MYTHSVSHAHFSDTFSLRGVQTSRTRMARGVCSAHVTCLHLTLAILMFHPPSLLFPHGHFDISFPCALSLPNCSRSDSAGQAYFRTSGEEFGYLADPTYSTGVGRKSWREKGEEVLLGCSGGRLPGKKHKRRRQRRRGGTGGMQRETRQK